METGCLLIAKDASNALQNQSEPAPARENVDSIKFALDLVPLVLNGTKTYTYRLGNKFFSTAVGQELLAADELGEVFGKLLVLEKSITTFGSLPLRRLGHEEYASRAHQIQTFASYYGRTPNESEPVTIIRFALVGHSD